MKELSFELVKEPKSQKEIRKKVLKLAGPSLVEMMLMNFVQMLNMIMVGHVGVVAITAVGLTNQPFFLSLAVFMALNVGATALVARSIGANEPEMATRAAKQTLVVNFVLSIIISVLGVVFAKPILLFLGAEQAVLDSGIAFFNLVTWSIVPAAITMGLGAVLRGAGDTITPMRINVLSNILVVVLGYPLIYGLGSFEGYGLTGAGIATLISRIVSSMIFLWVVLKGNKVIKISFREDNGLDLELLRRITKIGIPSAMEQVVMQCGQILVTIFVAGLGTTVFAAHQIGFSILGLSFMPGMAFAIAASTLVGQEMGAKQPDLAERYGWETRRFGMWVAGSVAVIFFLFGEWIMALYTSNKEVIELGGTILKIIALAQLSQATQFILAGALRGAGDTKWPLYSTFIGIWGIRVVLTYLFVVVFHWGLAGAWSAIVADQVIRSFIIVNRYRKGAWKKIKV